MKLIETTCPNCGASLKVDMERGFCYCEYCGTKLILDDEAQHVRIDNAEQAGYEFEKGRQRAQQEYNEHWEPYVETTAEPKKRKTFLWILGWIFIFPLPLMLIMIKNKSLPVWARVLISVAGWIVYLAIAFGSRNG